MPVTFSRAGSVPFQENWTGFDVTVPANATVEWAASDGQWRAGMFPGGDYFAPDGTGAFALRTLASGNLTLRPAGNGRVQIGSDRDPNGYTSRDRPRLAAERRERAARLRLPQPRRRRRRHPLDQDVRHRPHGLGRHR